MPDISVLPITPNSSEKTLTKMFDQAAKALFPDPVECISLLELVFIQAVVDEYDTDDTVLETIHESAEEMFLSLREHAEEGE